MLIEKYGKTPNFSGKQHFYSYFQNPSENSVYYNRIFTNPMCQDNFVIRSRSFICEQVSVSVDKREALCILMEF